MKKLVLFISIAMVSIGLPAQKQVWTTEKANAWYATQAWPVGCNFIPSSAINELEMWQNETFDKVTIDRELGWAEGIGMNVVRVFLHNIPWQTDARGFKQNMEQYLAIADRHHIRTMFVLFDDCWNDDPHPGKQPDPKPGVHNSGWMQCPGRRMHNDSSTWGQLENYTKDILSSFKDDKRILLWDLYNEPGNSNYGLTTLPLLKKIFQWAWTIRPSQPLTCGIWFDNAALNEFQMSSSDVISFHNYNKAGDLEKQINELLKSKRPVICSEYMARTRDSKFETHLPIFKKYKVGAINWGFVSGKTNTIYQWDKPVPDGSEPLVWFHDIFRKDGSPFDPREVAIIKKLTQTP
ncbi:MAG TPA: cellulase family glycosylhydrolase [Puia sp.]|nr:cellulase family glycosylhydrolase [Puia sp.]